MSGRDPQLLGDLGSVGPVQESHQNDTATGVLVFRLVGIELDGRHARVKFERLSSGAYGAQLVQLPAPRDLQQDTGFHLHSAPRLPFRPHDLEGWAQMIRQAYQEWFHAGFLGLAND
ncbi:hypothetical protein ABZV58_10290 [Nocardia sp. NPDC004654]|uniref:hypothetical protein n=1 Tax=Nocardia sp. NPDC004654 TaxID=3154776 RepID=UPI0033BB8392